MSNEEIINRLKTLLSKKLGINAEAEKLDGSTDLIKYGIGVDSISVMEFIVALENEFDIEIDETEFDPTVFGTMRSLASHIADK